MTRKIHLRRNKNPEIKVLAACASNPCIDGSQRNQRASCQFMASEIVGWEDFQLVPAADRCMHCCDSALIIRNRQRKAKGLPPVTTPFEGCSAAVK